MDIEKVVSDISLYLKLFLEENHPIEKKEYFAFPANAKAIIGAYANETDPQKEESVELIKRIIAHCSDDALDDLILEYGEDSLLGQVIRQKRVSNYLEKQQKSVVDIQKSLEESLLHTTNYLNPFYDMVCKQIDEKGFKSDSDFYNTIGMPRQLFARLRDPKACLSKKTVLWIIIGLKLNYNEAVEMLSKAGYSFRKNEKKDVILSYILRNTTYDLFFVNEILCHFEEEPFC